MIKSKGHFNMKAIVILLLLGLVNFLEGKRFRCDYKYFEEAEGWLKLHKIPANWQEARLRCQLEGGHLASPINNGIRSAMISMMSTNQSSQLNIFTGIHATFARGEFFSMEGIPLRKIPEDWAENEPDNCNNEENCILMTSKGLLADVKCDDILPYMCYKKSTKNMVVTGCGTVDPEYKLDTRTGSCYKFHRTARTWPRAFMTCACEGGYLAIINGYTETEVIRDIFEDNPSSTMTGKWKDTAFIGIHDWNEHGDLRTIEGQTLKEAGFSRFDSNQPNNLTTELGGQFCGAIERDVVLNDVWCEELFPFICEKSPDSLLCDDDDINDL